MTQRKIVLALTLAVLAFALTVPYTFNQQQVSVAFNYVNEWVHVSVDGEQLESLHLEKIGADYQVYFHSYNSSETVYEQFIIFANEPFSDPLRKFEVFWDGSVSVTNEVIFSFSSTDGIVSVIVSSYTAQEGPIEGFPPMNNIKRVVTDPDVIYDVLLDDEPFCSFDWNWITISVSHEGNSTTTSNQTLPQIRIYDLEGTVVDTRLITASLKPLAEYGGINGVGWMMDTMTSSYVKWLIYSSYLVGVRPSTGWGAPSLNYFNVYPMKVEPKKPVTISFILPEGVTTYETNLDEPFLARYLMDEVEETYDPSTRQYTLTFGFNNKAKGNEFTVSIYTNRQGVPYQSSGTIQVLPPWTETIFWTTLLPIIVIVFILTAFFLTLRWLIRRRRMQPPSRRILSRSY